MIELLLIKKIFHIILNSAIFSSNLYHEKLSYLYFSFPQLFWEKGYLQKNKKSYAHAKGIRIASYQSPELIHLTAIKQINTDTIFALNIHLKDDNQHFGDQWCIRRTGDGTSLLMIM